MVFYQSILQSLFQKLKQSFTKQVLMEHWFLLRIQTSYYTIIQLTGNYTLQAEKLKKQTSFVNQAKAILYLPVLFYKIKKTESRIRKKLNGKTLLLGYQKHNVKAGTYNMYLHPFYVKDKAEIFYLDYKNNNNELEIYFRMLTQFYNVSSFFSIKKNISTLANAAAEFISKEGKINSDKLEDKLIYTLSSFPAKQNAAYRFLKILQPKEILFYCFYNTSINAFIYAANNLKIRTIEYQHSIITSTHHAYTYWEDAGILRKHFPAIFYVWSDDEKKVIENYFSIDSINNYIPEILVVGNKYLDLKKKEINAENADIALNLLVCLQGIWIPEFLEQYILQDTKYKWYFRLHPRYPNDKEKLIKLQQRKVDNIEIEAANNKELFDVFAEVSTVITSFSGTAVEAENFDKKIIIFGELGYEAYKEKIEANTYKFIQSVSDIKQVLN